MKNSINSANTCLKVVDTRRDVKDGVSAGVSGTPAFFINGIFLAGALPASEFEKIIDEELQLASRESAQK